MGSKTKLRLTGYKQRIHAASPYMRTLHLFNAMSLTGGILYGLYYGVFLYKQTFSLSTLAIDGLIGGFGAWFGYILGVHIVRRYGYSRCIKTAFGCMALISFATALLTGRIADFFMLLAFCKALPAGVYAATVDTIMIRELRDVSRNNFLQVKLSLEFLAGILLPTAVGTLVSFTKGYQLAFVLAGCIYLIALCIPVTLPRPDVSLNLKDVLRTFKRPLYLRHAVNRTLAGGFNQLNGFVLMIIPFLMLKNEMKVGLLASGIALMAGLVSLLVRKVKTHQKLTFGYTAYTVRGLASLMFVLAWSPQVLIIWQLVNKLATPLHDPLQQGLDIQNDSLIMGSDVQKEALHINVLNNTLLLLGTTAAYGMFFLITTSTVDQQRLVLQLLILGYAAWRFINLTVTYRINSLAQNLAG